VDDIEEQWHQDEKGSPLAFYSAGSWGPAEAEALIERDGRAWRRL
jgi:glucose-6-phosphate 1-dehydrogenase